MVIVGDELDYMWSEETLEAVKRVVAMGYNLEEIAEMTERDVIEVVVLLDHLIKKRELPEKKHNIFGPRKEKRSESKILPNLRNSKSIIV